MIPLPDRSTVLCDECGLTENDPTLAYLTAERDRYKAALEQIKGARGYNGASAHFLKTIAREALR